MHELGLVKNMMCALEKAVADPEVGEVNTVVLSMGQLRQVVPEILEACFRHFPKPEKLAHAQLQCDIMPLVIECTVCGTRTSTSQVDMKCPECKSGEVNLISGNEFTIDRIEW